MGRIFVNIKFDYEQPLDDFNEYLRVIDEDYTINESIEFNIYKDPAHQIQNYYDVHNRKYQRRKELLIQYFYDRLLCICLNNLNIIKKAGSA